MIIKKAGDGDSMLFVSKKELAFTAGDEGLPLAHCYCDLPEFAVLFGRVFSSHHGLRVIRIFSRRIYL